ncbi:major outer capsid protein sigma 2 [Baboon orthoreovirus]|uniref:Major outer capsid protein sigma 2 n=1 Tax=Baboon orthoreovirus TaxID=75888 RepID=O72465_9REOV|nr:major outer capsid protein sigma 2 [Baboon orthoreovirus]AAC18128.1 major outer capsid protein sigma 2 [Baboon orthoreovirus]
MEVPLVHAHSVLEGLSSALHDVIPAYSSTYGWLGDEFAYPDVVKLGNAYVCTRCCGVLHYGEMHGGNPFIRHICKQTHSYDTSPICDLYKLSRITRRIYDAHVNILTWIANNIITDKTNENSATTPGLEIGSEIPDGYKHKSRLTDGKNFVELPLPSFPYASTSEHQYGTQVWNERFEQFFVQRELVSPRRKIRTLLRFFINVLSDEKRYYPVFIPGGEGVPKWSFDTNLYEFGLKRVNQPMPSMIPQLFNVRGTSPGNDTFFSEHHGDIKKYLLGTDLIVAPLAGNVPLIIGPLDDRYSRPMPYVRPETQKALCNNLLVRITKGWSQDHVQYTCPMGVIATEKWFSSVLPRTLYLPPMKRLMKQTDESKYSLLVRGKWEEIKASWDVQNKETSSS